MIDSHELKKRNLYLNKLIAFQDTEPVKIVTGIRRCGKSSLLKLMVVHLKENGITDEQIIEMNFESHAFKKMTSDDLYDYVKQHVHPQKRMYLFLMKFKECLNGRMPLTLSVWILTVISILQVLMRICFHQNTPHICPADR